MDGGAWWAAVHGVAKSRTWLSDFTFTFHFHALEKEMATHSSVLAWRIPGTGEPGGLPSTGSHRVRHDWSDIAAAAAVILQGIFQGEMKTCLHTKNCLNIVVSLFVMAKIWKQSKYSLTDKYLSKLQYVEYDLLKCATTTTNRHESPKDHANRMNPII